MGYENQTAILIGTFTKLNNKKNNLEKKAEELRLQLDSLKQYNGSETSIIVDLLKEISTNDEKLYVVTAKLKALQNRLDGGASLDPFLTSKGA